jgi:hypothetical protein
MANALIVSVKQSSSIAINCCENLGSISNVTEIEKDSNVWQTSCASGDTSNDGKTRQ